LMSGVTHFSGVYVGPQIGMNPESLWGLPNLEYWQIPTQTDSGIPVPIWGPRFECRSNLGTIGDKFGRSPNWNEPRIAMG
jgi:hypothetical protein